MSRSHAFTVIELLIALVIFVIVMTFAYRSSLQSLQLNRDNEAISNAQGKARRVLEVLSQDLRTSAFGIIANTPYNSTTSAISFPQVVGGAGYSVSAVSGSSLSIISNSASITTDIPIGTRLVVIDGNGNAVLTKTSSLPTVSGTNTYTLSTTCTSLPVTATSETLASVVNILSYSYDSTNNKIIYRQQGDAADTDVAFDITDFRVDYIYKRFNATTTSEERNPPGYLDNGKARVYFTSGGSEYTLRRLQFTLSTQIPTRGRNIERTYNGQVDMVNTLYYSPKAVTSCNP